MRFATALSSMLILAGCAIGKAEFTCKGIPEGASCMSASELYEASKYTDGPVTGNRETPESSDAAPAMREGQRTASGWVPEIEGGALPLRTPSRVMRIWIAPWEGEDADLHLSTLVYTEIESRRWMIGSPGSKRVREITPLQATNVVPTTVAASPPTAAARPSANRASGGTAGKNVPPPYGTTTAARSGTSTPTKE